MEKLPQVPETYDRMFQEGGYGGAFHLTYRRSPYYPMFKGVAKLLRGHAGSSVLEVGCGTGNLAQLLFDSTSLQYQGFDFSPVAVQMATRRTGRPDFYVGDATQAQTYAGRRYDAIVCTEVLEHIEQDLEAVRLWAPGSWCVCSVPNYDADTHVRHFLSEQEVRARYGALIEIERIDRICKPFLQDLTVRNWLQAMRWNRYRPRRLRWLLGFSDFDRNGGWFVFAGRRKLG